MGNSDDGVRKHGNRTARQSAGDSVSVIRGSDSGCAACKEYDAAGCFKCVGFIRNYARLLEVDAEPLLASYRASVSADTDKVIAVKSSMSPVQLSKDTQSWFKYILASVLVLIFLLVWLFYVEYTPKQVSAVPEKAPEAIPETAPAVTQPLPEIALSAAQREAEMAAANLAEGANVAPDVQVAEAKSPNASAASARLAHADSKPAVQSAQQPQATQKSQLLQQPQVSVASSTAKSLSLAFTAQSWVSVSDKSGKVVYEKMSHNGDKVNGTPPFRLVIGNASATKLSFGGKDVDLTAYTNNNVARITLE
jgi:cytoskeleton protein RodZ